MIQVQGISYHLSHHSEQVTPRYSALRSETPTPWIIVYNTNDPWKNISIWEMLKLQTNLT